MYMYYHLHKRMTFTGTYLTACAQARVPTF